MFADQLRLEARFSVLGHLNTERRWSPRTVLLLDAFLRLSLAFCVL